MTNSWIRKGAPEPQGRERLRRCCAKCRRGTPEQGTFPCGLALACACHERGRDEEFDW